MAEFGVLSLSQFQALLDRAEVEHKRAFLCSGIVAASIYNANPFRGKDAQAVDPREFIPGYKSPKDVMVQDWKEQVRIFSSIMGCGPGKK